MTAEVVLPGIHGVYRRMVKARILVDTNFPDLGTNLATQKAFKDFFGDTEFPPDDRIAIEQVARGRLNGSSGDIFGARNAEVDMHPGQPVELSTTHTGPSIQRPH